MPLRRIVGAGFALRQRDGGTTTPRAATMMSRRVADSAGRSRRSTVVWDGAAGYPHPTLRVDLPTRGR
ncbi:hypothetical protein [Mesorhizobium sp. ZC-5]|uniref:hypothetical protein n=1 Tax=Mesorhizobium sp. ZC-5 TaxID=2986066 RepID=UPI0021E90E20|nr:hypothetical protein [Mesorhizobium sp. ZC-5]MCV3238715.1 hypothetical protein [Mesorhizobium sp. ZC-5]